MKILTLLSPGLLTGNELPVGTLQRPALARLQPRERALSNSEMARMLGNVMPFWMAATLVLLGFSSWRASHNKKLWGPSTLPMALVIVWTILLPVPINNRIRQWDADQLPNNWASELSRFAWFHNIRVALLMVSTVLALRAATSVS